jgi:hypothetical protein
VHRDCSRPAAAGSSHALSPGRLEADAFLGYRYLICQDWSALPEDLDAVEGIVSVMAVTDPFGDFSETDLARAVPDFRRPYKTSFVVDLTNPTPSAHHRARARKSARRVTVEVGNRAGDAADDLERLYVTLRERHSLSGITSLARDAIAALITTPGAVAVRGFIDGACVSMSLYLIVDGVAYAHLVAADETGYRSAASCLVYDAAIEAFRAAGLQWLEVGNGAGTEATSNDGLSSFKRGWASSTRQAYLCERIVEPAVYTRLTVETNTTRSRFFPAYRSPYTGDEA